MKKDEKFCMAVSLVGIAAVILGFILILNSSWGYTGVGLVIGGLFATCLSAGHENME
jgi:uncharacterized membrane protein